jgi:hypothetical protein
MKIVVDNATKQQAARLLLAALALLLSVLLGVRIAPAPDAVLCPPCPECPTAEPATSPSSPLNEVEPADEVSSLFSGQYVALASCGL